jgi:hypothetical protein
MHTYAIAIPGRGLQNIVSLLSEDVVFAKGLVPQAVVGKLRKASSDGGTLTQANFVGNPAFVDFLHQVIAVHAPREAEFIAEAKRRVTGRVYVVDGRTATPQGDVPPGMSLEDFAWKTASSRPIRTSQTRIMCCSRSRGFSV